MKYSDYLVLYRKILIFLEFFAIFLSFIILEILSIKNDLGLDSSVRISFYVIEFSLWVINLGLINNWSLSIVNDQFALFKKNLDLSLRILIQSAFIFYFLKLPISRVQLVLVTIIITVELSLINLYTQIILIQRKKNILPKKYLLIENPSDPIDLSFIKASEYVIERYSPPNLNDEKNWISGLRKHVKDNGVDAIAIGYGTIKNNIFLLEIAHFYAVGISEILIASKLTYLVPQLKTIGSADILRIQEPSIRVQGLILKRVFDLLFSFLAIIICLPLFLIISILIKITSKGSILFFDERIGIGNTEFRMPKFRTMQVGSNVLRKEIIGNLDEDIVERYKNDPRITRVGGILRRWSLDELPQLFLVLKGTMSIVGPRPIIKEELMQVNSSQYFRYMAKPGLTGLWQIKGRKEVPWAERMAMDIAYIETWSLYNDIRLILSTLGAILSGKGAY